MKKRILSLILACVLFFSSLPAISVGASDGSSENSYQVASYQEFVDFLNKAETLEEAYCEITSDFAAPEGSDAIGRYSIENVHIDGKGHIISGLKIKDALFSTFANSSLRNLTFDSAQVTSSVTEGQVALAVVAQSIEDKNSNVTSCIFDNCQIVLPDVDADAAFVATENHGVVTNCIVWDTCVVERTPQAEAEHRVGGITVSNISGSKVINCVSKLSVTLNIDNDNCTVAGIAVSNKGKVDLCYVNSPSVGENYIVADSSSIGNSSYYVVGSGFYLGKSEFYDTEQLDVLGAEMSQNAMMYVSNYESATPLKEEDYPVLWNTGSGELSLSFDPNTAQIYLMVDESMKDADLSFSLGAVEVETKTGRRFTTTAGKYYDGEYIRNTLDITFTCGENDYKMVNNFVYSPSFKYIEKLTNPYDSKNYSTVFIVSEQNGVVNTGKVELLPYCWKLSISNISENDELVDYEFRGKGTEASPYAVRNAYELDVLSHYVRQGRENADGLAYNAAHYTLEADLDLEGTKFVPIGEYSSSAQTAFKGVFDGKSHTIKNLTLAFDDDPNENDYLGLFGYVVGSDNNPAVIKSLNVVSANAETSGSLCGIIAGAVQKAEISGCVTSGTVSGGTQVAGIVGYANRSKINNCGSTATLSTNSSNASGGGIVGYSEHATVRNCYFAGSINAKNVVEEYYLRIGSITGYFENTTFDNCYQSLSVPDDTAASLVGRYDIAVLGISYKSGTELKSDEFLSNLKNYTSRAALGTWWGKDGNNINSGYPISEDNSLSEYSITCVPTLSGTVSTDRELAVKGTEITVTVSSSEKLKEILITNTNREVQNVVCEKTEEGTYVFRMPAYNVRVVPVFETELLLSGKGTADDPYIIRNYTELSTVADNCYYNRACPEGATAYPYAYYEVANNIDCGGKTILPMGNRYYPFSGHFNGNGYTISNLKPSPSAEQVSHDYAYPAVFGYCNNAEIFNLTLEEITLSGNRSAVIASTAGGSTKIYNVTIRNCVISNCSYGGGFVSQATDLSLINCLAEGIAFENSSDCGYVVWSVQKGVSVNNIVVNNSSGASDMIKSSNAKLSEEDFVDFYACDTEVTGTKVNVTNISSGRLVDKQFVAQLSENAYYINLDYVIFWGLDTSTKLAYKNTVPGILPIYYEDEFFDDDAVELFKNVIRTANINSTVEIPLNTVADFTHLKIYTASGVNIGFAIENDGTSAVLTFVMPAEPVYISNSGVVPDLIIPGSGTQADPYVITMPQQLHLVSLVTNGLKAQTKDKGDVDYIKAHFVVGNDIDYTPQGNWSLPIGSEENPFTGTFDGKGYTISRLKAVSTDKKYFGLFGVVKGAQIKNLNIGVDYDLAGNSDFCVGGLCGFVLSAQDAETGEYIPSVIDNCKVSGIILVNTADTLGGVCGQLLDYSTIERCINDAYLISMETFWLGGIAGVSRSLINNCANWGNIDCEDGWRVGGINAGDASFMNEIKNCYTKGKITGSYSEIGVISPNTEGISNCYYLETVSTSQGKTAEQFKSGEVAYLLNGGVTDGTQAWYQNIDNGQPIDRYPMLKGSTVYANYKCDGELEAYSNTDVPILHDFNNYHVCKRCIGLREGEIAGIYGFSISLGGNIAISYYMVLDDCVLEDVNAKMVFTVPDTGYRVEIPVSEGVKSDQFYVFTCEVAAKEMASDIYCQIVTDNDTSDNFRYSVKEYAEIILANPESYEKEIPLVKAMLNYGAAAQVYFNYHTEKLANDSEYISEADKVLPQVDLTPYQHILEGEQKGVSYYGSSLVLKSETAIKHYFYFENEKDVEMLDITVDGEKVTPVKNGSYYEIKISDIPAHRLHKMHEVKVGGITLNYCAFSYGLIAMNGTNENLKNTVRAMYVYNQEAILYNEK